MSRSRPASNPLSYHKQTGQYYITRAGKRIYLGAVRDEALEKYHRMNLGLAEPQKPVKQVPLTAKELANRFLAAQQANWRRPETTLRSYRAWSERIWTILATCASQGRNAFDFICQSIQAHFSDQPLPSLLGP